MCDVIEIDVGDVTEGEAYVVARYVGGNGECVELSGTIKGPYCAGVRTLAAEFLFRPLKDSEVGVAMAEGVVTDPCMWSEEMPHLYNVNVVARHGGDIVAEYRGQIVLRLLARRA